MRKLNIRSPLRAMRVGRRSEHPGFNGKPVDDRGFDTCRPGRATVQLREGDAFPGCGPQTHFSAEKFISYKSVPLVMAGLAELDGRGRYDENNQRLEEPCNSHRSS